MPRRQKSEEQQAYMARLLVYLLPRAQIFVLHYPLSGFCICPRQVGPMNWAQAPI